MLKTFKELFFPQRSQDESRPQLERAVAALLHEAARVDDQVTEADLDVASTALAELLGASEARAQALLTEASDPARRLTSYYRPVSVINKAFAMEQRIRLVEYLWRITHTDTQLHLYEDHLVRKIADLLHLSNTQSMLARRRAREDPAAAQELP